MQPPKRKNDKTDFLLFLDESVNHNRNKGEPGCYRLTPILRYKRVYQTFLTAANAATKPAPAATIKPAVSCEIPPQIEPISRMI